MQKESDRTQTPTSLVQESRVLNWSHNPYAKDSADAKVTEIAKIYISLIEEELHKKSIHAVTGVEMEIDTNREYELIEYLNSQKEKINDEIERANKNRKGLGYYLAAVGLASKSRGKFIHPQIYSVYNDRGNPEITTMPAPPLRTASLVWGIKKALMEADSEFSKRLQEEGHSKKNISSGARIREALPELAIRHSSVSKLLREKFTLGEHINLSLHRYKEGKYSIRNMDLGAHNVTLDRNWRYLLAQAFVHHSTDDMALFLGGKQSYGRLSLLLSDQDQQGILATSKTLGNYKDEDVRRQAAASVKHEDYDYHENDENCQRPLKVNKGERFSRVEFRLPDSSSNIFLTTLATLSSTWLAVSAVENITRKIPQRLSDSAYTRAVEAMKNIHSHSRLIPETPEKALERFDNNSLVLSVMETLGKKYRQDKVESDIALFRKAIHGRTNSLYDMSHSRPI